MVRIFVFFSLSYPFDFCFSFRNLGSPLVSNQRDNTQLTVLLDFFEKIGCSPPLGTELNASPMIVHCSAGIGRSGATIAIDMILNRIRTEGFDIEIEIPGLITHIRSQRSGKEKLKV